jgi:uncharacterized protein (TIRG00374 family)
VATSIAQWIFIAISQYLALIALDIRVPFTASFVILAFTVIGLTLPAGPGFFGTVEYCFVLALAPYGVSSSQAFPAAIFYHLLNYISVTIVGLYFARKVGYSISRIREVTGSTTGKGKLAEVPEDFSPEKIKSSNPKNRKTGVTKS